MSTRRCGGKQTNAMPKSMEVKQFDHLGYGKCRAPLLFQNVKTDTSITVDIWVINLGAEGNLHHKQLRSIVTKSLYLIEHSL